VNETITFNAASSYDPNGGTIVSYEWDFGDGTTSDQQNPTHRYAQEGSYTVVCVGNFSNQETAKSLDIAVDVKGGGIMGQASAARQAIAKALVEHNKKLKETFLNYDSINGVVFKIIMICYLT
jgi:PKD repeat protein